MFDRPNLSLVVAFACVALAIGGGLVPMVPSDRAHRGTDVVLALESQAEARRGTIPSNQEVQVAELRRIGGTIFERKGSVVEVNLNRTKVRDGDLDRLAGLSKMTDLSLEETSIGDDGLRRLSGL